MFERWKPQLIKWHARTSEREKLQFVYLLVIVVSLLVAAVVGLVSYRVGHRILLITVVAIVAYAVNAVLWSLVQTFLLAKLPGKGNRR